MVLRSSEVFVLNKRGFQMESASGADAIIAGLKQFARSSNLVGGTKAARDAMKLEMYGRLLGAVKLPERSRAAVSELLSKRMRIVDNLILARELGAISLSDALVVFAASAKTTSERKRADWLLGSG